MPAQLNALCQIPRLYLAWNTVKAKGSVGGIDGISILEFEKEKRIEISKLAEELKAGMWKPQPYMEIAVAKTKNPEEMRKLGMTAIRDKIVQHAIKSVIEPRYEKIFLGNSYGYRPFGEVCDGAIGTLREISRRRDEDGANYFATGKKLAKIIIKREDWVNIYPLCTECYARITYIPDIKKKEPVKIVVI